MIRNHAVIQHGDVPELQEDVLALRRAQEHPVVGLKVDAFRAVEHLLVGGAAIEAVGGEARG